MTGRSGVRAPVPPSSAEHPYPGRTPHWIKGNQTERIPHRWIVADTEAKVVPAVDGECQTLRCAVGLRWRDDLPTGDHEERAEFTDALEFWRWVIEYCYPHGRTCLAFHNAGYDVAILDAFTMLPAIGCELIWCNLDRDVSVITWRTPRGTLVIWDTYTWTGAALESLAPLTGITKPRLPAEGASEEAWLEWCRADTAITAAVVRELLAFVRAEHLGNWQPSGAGMGHTALRHRFYTHKLLVHDDADALHAERVAMHTGRAEAWWHGEASGGPFTEWDMSMSYCRIAAECMIPAKLWDTDNAPSKRVHAWALEHWRTLAAVTVQTDVPCVPARLGDRIAWPVGRFETTLWDTELELLRELGGAYTVQRQWRYTRKPALEAWARWSMQMCGLGAPVLSDVARVWVKHQSRATIGRMALRNASWERYCGNWMRDYTGISYLTEDGKGTTRLMHVGADVWRESERAEAQQSIPQVTSWIMAEARARLMRAAAAAGLGHVLHVDTDSLIADHAGDQALELAVAAGLPGGWRRKRTWRALEVTGPRHYRTPDRRQVPGVPRRAEELEPGVYVGEVWDSLARALAEGRTGEVRVRMRRWEPKRVDHRRPYRGEVNGPALPIQAGADREEEVPSDEAMARRTNKTGRKSGDQAGSGQRQAANKGGDRGAGAPVSSARARGVGRALPGRAGDSGRALLGAGRAPARPRRAVRAGVRDRQGGEP